MTDRSLRSSYTPPHAVVVLCSGGIDSVTALHMAEYSVKNSSNPHAEIHVVSIDYGQRHRKEIEYAAYWANDFKAHHKIINLSSVIPTTMLTNDLQEVPNISYADIEGVSPTYVPYRNGLMLSAATAYVVGVVDKISAAIGDNQEAHAWLYAGMHADDAAGFAYPDCTPEWVGSQANAILLGTYGKVRLVTPLLHFNKSEIVSAGHDHGIDWKHTWSCYKGEELHCGMCPTCIARKEAFEVAHIVDPTSYAQ